ncbi:hypothetical protein HN51_035505 [Arachis hypogaea]
MRVSTPEKIKEKNIEVNEKERVVLEHHRSEELEIQRELLEVGWDAVVMMSHGLREVEHDKDRKVFAVEDLDEWHEGFLKTRTDNPLMYPAVMVSAESMESQTISNEAISERTETWEYRDKRKEGVDLVLNGDV